MSRQWEYGEIDLEPGVARAAHRLGTQLEGLRGQDILVLVPDRTRQFDPALTLLPLLDGLIENGASGEAIRVAIASGSHVATEDDVRRLGRLPHGVRVLRHDPDGPSALAGTTPGGTEVRVNPALLESDVVCAIGPVAFHYFAGFGGGGKLLFPGLGERRSIAANHRLSLAPERGLANGVEPGRTRDNPVARDLREAHRLLPQAHHLTLGTRLGTEFACRWSNPLQFDLLCKVWASERIRGEARSADMVLGNAQPDIDVVQSHKALYHLALYARDGASILLGGACPEGIGSPTLARWLALPDRATLEREARANYDLNAQTAISLAAIAERTEVTWIARSERRAFGPAARRRPTRSARLRPSGSKSGDFRRWPRIFFSIRPRRSGARA